MTLSLLGALLPFPLLKTFELDRTNEFVPATYSRFTAQQGEQFLLIATDENLIRITEQYDGWRLHNKKVELIKDPKACCILEDDKVLVASY